MGCENTYLVKHKDSTTLPVPQGVNKQTKIPEAWRLEPSFPKYVSLISPLLCVQAWLGRGMSERDFSCRGLLNYEQHIHLKSAFITSFSSVNKSCDCESSSKLFLVQQNIGLVAPTFPEIYALATLFSSLIILCSPLACFPPQPYDAEQMEWCGGSWLAIRPRATQQAVCSMCLFVAPLKDGCLQF